MEGERPRPPGDALPRTVPSAPPNAALRRARGAPTRGLLAFTLLFAGCVPRVDVGPVPVERAARAVEVVVRPASLPEVHFVATVEAGSAYDPPGAEGLAHLTAQAAALGAASAVPGARFDVAVDRDRVALALTCPAAAQRDCADLFASALASPRFEAADVDEARERARGLTRALADDPEALGRAALATLVFEAHPYAHPPAGRSSVQPLLTVARIRDFHAKHWVREAVRVGVTGPVDTETPARLEQGLRALPATMAQELPLMAPLPARAPTLAVVETPAAEGVATLHVGWPARVGTPDGRGRLPEALRAAGVPAEVDVDLPGLVCGAGASYRRQPHLVATLGPLTPEQAPVALQALTVELRRLAEGLTDDERAAAAAQVDARRAALAADPVRSLACQLAAGAVQAQGPASAPRDPARPAAALDPGVARIVAVAAPRSGLSRSLVEDEPSPLVHRSPGPGVALVTGTAPEPDKLQLDGVWTLSAEELFR